MSQQKEAVSGSSVRSLFAAYCMSRPSDFPKRVIFTAITLKDMASVAEALHHKVSSVSIDHHTQQPDLQELETELQLHPGSIVVLTPLFGAVVDYQAAVAICRRYAAEVVIDNAQGFRGLSVSDYDDYDLLLWSFGPIKTMTALAGGIGLLPDRGRAESLRNTVNRFKNSSSWQFRLRMLKYTIIAAVSRPWAFTLLIYGLKLLRIRPDALVKNATRSYNAKKDLMVQITRRPNPLQQKLFYLQLSRYPLEAIQIRTGYGRFVIHQLDHANFMGAQSPIHSFWLLPFICKNPDLLCMRITDAGFHGSRQTSALKVLDPVKHPELQRLFNRVVYLPIDQTMPKRYLPLLCEQVESAR